MFHTHILIVKGVLFSDEISRQVSCLETSQGMVFMTHSWLSLMAVYTFLLFSVDHLGRGSFRVTHR